MDSKVDNATAAGLASIIKPRLLRTVRIVKNQIDRKSLTDLISPDQLPEFLQCVGMAIRQIDTEQAICRAGYVNHFADFLCSAAQRFLAKHRCALIQD